MSVMTAANAPKLFAKSTKAINASRACVTALILALFGAGVSAQTLAPSPYLTVLDNNGRIINQACIWTYAAGTSTPIATYTDAALTTPNTNPIRSDASGRYVAYLTNGLAYKFVVENLPCSAISHGVVLKTVDNIASVPASNVNLDIAGTAGQALAANDVVFLSDGSRGNTAGLWYQADADFQDAALNALTIGVVPVAIANGASGSIRIQGRITGLSGLTPGASYFVSATAGQVTNAPPLLARFVGESDSTTTLILGANPRKTLLQPASLENCGRLTLTTGVPVTTADVSAATSLYFTPDGCNRIALYDGTSEWSLRTFSELTISLAGCTASRPYDVFIYDNAGTPTAETLIWTNATTRATALALQNGVNVKSGATTRRYVGSYYCNSTGGQTDSTFAKQYVWNMDNRVSRAMRLLEATATWTYNSATLHQANGAPADQLDVLVGLPEDPIDVRVLATADGTAADYAIVSIGLDSTTTTATGTMFSAPRLNNTSYSHPTSASLTTYPGVGRHTLVWLEARSGAMTVTFTGASSVAQSGIWASWRN